jgi:hypothetical protein
MRREGDNGLVVSSSKQLSRKRRPSIHTPATQNGQVDTVGSFIALKSEHLSLSSFRNNSRYAMGDITPRYVICMTE